MSPELAQALLEWRDLTLYNQDDDWVFTFAIHKRQASVLARVCSGRPRPPRRSKSKDHKADRLDTFRHSLASLLGDKKEDRRIVQRHASCVGKDAGRLPASATSRPNGPH